MKVLISIFSALLFSVQTVANEGVEILRYPVEGAQGLIACSGEKFTAESGEVQFLRREHVDGNGKVHLTYRFQLVNMWGTTDQGNIYRGVGNTRGWAPYDSWISVMLPEFPPNPDTAPIILRHNVSSRLIPVRGSSGTPSIAIVKTKLTINANGDVVLDTGEIEEIRCPGA